MGFADEVAHEQTGLKREPLCKIARALTSFTPEDSADLKEALADPSVMHESIVRALVARGIGISPDGVSRHRKGRCVCTR